MKFMPAVKTALTKYVPFEGRACRSEFWWYSLFGAICGIVAASADGLMTGDIGGVYLVVALGLLLPSVAVNVRRLHDIGRSGWWYFIALVPIVGAIVLLVWYCTKGTAGTNRFGDDPLMAAS